jgi:phenylalanyl-tRNA synthetase alpha subunit
MQAKTDVSLLDTTLPADPYFVGAEHPIAEISQRVINYFYAFKLSSLFGQ